MSMSFRPLQDGDTANPRELERYLRELEREVDRLSRAIESSSARSASPTIGLNELELIRAALQSGGVVEMDLTDLTGINAQTVDVRIPRVTTAPDPVTTPYDTYVLVGSPYSSLWQIDRSVNPPVAVQVASVATHDLLSAIHSDTLAGAVVRGDVIVGNATPKWARLAKGTANQAFRMDGTGTDPGWGALADAALSANVALLNRNPQAFTGTNTFAAIGGQITLSGSASISVADTPYALPDTIFIVFVDSSGGAVTVNLPAAVAQDRHVVVKDLSGNAAANNITVGGNGNNIDGAASKVINTNYGVYWITGNGASWSLL